MNIQDLNQTIKSDTGLSETEKQYLLKEEMQKDIEKFLAGGTGAFLGVVVAKYLKLSKTVQVILGGLGYGAGRAIYDFVKNQHPNWNYDDKNNTYNLDTKKY